jgi:hypothetical protein
MNNRCERSREGNKVRKKENKNKTQLTESQTKQMRMGRHRTTAKMTPVTEKA